MNNSATARAYSAQSIGLLVLLILSVVLFSRVSIGYIRLGGDEDAGSGFGGTGWLGGTGSGSDNETGLGGTGRHSPLGVHWRTGEVLILQRESGNAAPDPDIDGLRIPMTAPHPLPPAPTWAPSTTRLPPRATSAHSGPIAINDQIQRTWQYARLDKDFEPIPTFEFAPVAITATPDSPVRIRRPDLPPLQRVRPVERISVLPPRVQPMRL